jgi:hypothetical protein
MSKDKDCDYGKSALSFSDAVQVWLQRWTGMFQHHIAARFGVNPGRVNEVLKEKRHVGSRMIAEKMRKKSDD